jgi:hypothetical protein
MVVGAIIVAPLEAVADGGAYIQFDETHYRPGSPAVGTGYVWIPLNRQDLLERGPFYVYLVPRDTWIVEGRPLPDGVIRVGTASIEPERGSRSFEVRTKFTVPDVPGAYYGIQLCNEPCTISGFREALSGEISIVQTEREAQLLNEQQELWGKVWSFRHKFRKAERANEELEAMVADGRASVTELSFEVNHLQHELAAASPSPGFSAVLPPGEEDRPLVEAWALVAVVGALIVALLAVAVAAVFARRSEPRIVVPDTIEELVGEDPELDPASR